MATAGPELRREPTGDLIRRLVNDAQALFDKQIELARRELREDLQQIIGAAKSLGIAIGLLLMAAICFFNFIFLAIDRFAPGRLGWAAALVCTLLFAVVGGILVTNAIGQIKVQPLARTRATLKEDAEWAKHRLTSNGKSSQSEPVSREPSKS